jgi:hypothetical protein
MGDGGLDNGGWYGMITAVYGSPVGNIAVVNDENGFPIRVDIRTLCFDRHEPDGIRAKTPVFAVEGSDMYWPDTGGIFRAAVRTPNGGALVIDTTHSPIVIAATSARVFFADSKQVFRWEKTGESAIAYGEVPGAVSLVEASQASGRAVVITWPLAAYVADTNSTTLHPFDLGLTSVGATAWDGDDFFAAGNDGNGPAVAHADDKTVERFIAARCDAIAVDRTNFYCADDARIAAYDRKTKVRHDIFAFPGRPLALTQGETIHALAIDDTDIYFSYDRTSTRTSDGLVARVAKSGGVAHVIGDGLPRLGRRMFLTSDAVITTMNVASDNGDDDVISLPKRD